MYREVSNVLRFYRHPLSIQTCFTHAQPISISSPATLTLADHPHPHPRRPPSPSPSPITIRNLRALAAVFQGLVTTSPATYKQAPMIGRLMLHEANRVYGDRMVSEGDVERFQEVILKAAKQHMGDFNFEELTAEPNIFATFVEEAEGDQKLYLPLEGYDHLSKILTKQLALYNETFAVMNLVLFNQAMEHVSRISRIIDNPRGNALLVGVGGSGKQSLSRLAAFIGQYEVFQIKLTSSYGIVDFKEDLRSIYMKTGVKAIPMAFLFTDQQIFNENCLIFLNDILSLGYPPGLFAEEDKVTSTLTSHLHAHLSPSPQLHHHLSCTITSAAPSPPLLSSPSSRPPHPMAPTNATPFAALMK